jgi:Skp family chaperone for outer membrane proteins
MLRRFVTLAAIALIATAASAQTNVGVCNPNKVFDKLDEKKVILDQMQQRKSRIEAEIKQRREEAAEIERQRNDMRPGTPQWEEKNNLLAQKAVEFEVWGRIQQANMARQEKQLVIDLYNKIRTATKTVAQQKKLDIVLSERRPELPEKEQLEKLTPDQVRQLISQHDVLYMDEKLDITMDVVAQLNKDFATGGGTNNAGGAGAGGGANK